MREGVGNDVDGPLPNYGGHSGPSYYNFDEGNRRSLIHRILRSDDGSVSNRHEWSERHGEYVVVFHKGQMYQV